MTNKKMESEEEALFRSYPYALYFVQSPSTVSHANSAELRATADSALHSPPRPSSDNITSNKTTHSHEEATRLALSRYSSSRGSNDSFLHDKKIAYDVRSHHGNDGGERGEKCRIGVEDGEEEEEEEEEEDWGSRGWWWWWWRRYFSFRDSSSCGWISFQIGLRFMLSLGVALLVFYIATKPPPPKMSIKIGGIGEFGLGEGVDGSGVTTKILTCNCSVDVLIDNKSKLFTLHVHPPILAMSFANLPFAISRGPKLYALSDGSTSFELYVGTKNKPMYGAGRSMQDILESGKGLPLIIRISLTSRFHVVFNLIMLKFHHKAECLIVVGKTYDKKNRTQAYHSNCIITA